MIPGAFDYHRPTSLDEVVVVLAQHGDEGRVVAGGHSLIPMMELRLANPAHLIDLRAVPGLRGIDEADGAFRIGAMTAQARRRPGGPEAHELHPSGAVPLPPGARLGVRLRQLHRALDKALAAVDYADLRRVQAENRARGELMGIDVSFFTEIVGAGPTRNGDVLGVEMFDSCEIRIHPTGSAIARLGTKSQGHKTTYAQILASETGIPSELIQIEEGNTDTAPYGLGTCGSRSTPVAGVAAARLGRKILAKAQKIAAHLLGAAEDDLEWDLDRFKVKGLPEKVATMKEIAWAAYHNVPEGMEPGLEVVDYYDPPNMTYPFGAYICVVDIDRDTGETKVRRFYALDDCGMRINPMIIEGQVHGGLTEAFGIAMGQEIAYDEIGNVQGASLLDFFLPTAVETPVWETDHTVTPSPRTTRSAPRAWARARTSAGSRRSRTRSTTPSRISA